MKLPRRMLRDALLDMIRKFSRTDDAREMAAGTLTGLLDRMPAITRLNGGLKLTSLPYPEVGRTGPARPAAERNDVIFITARFRSGSTLLWNLFRNVPGCTAYYEPFNERRWFDAVGRGDHVDRTHKQVEDYWREYEGLEELGRYYDEAWTRRQLLMEADAWAPEMKRYIEVLIERATGRPVLQFNRVDFRLPWLRRNFPNATILHLYRHPRDQWCSTLMKSDSFSKDALPSDFAAYDHFYLRRWVRDLRFYFPFLVDSLKRHPYEAFYCIWRLSHLYGTNYGHYSLAFERLLDDTDRVLAELFAAANIEHAHIEPLKALIERPRTSRWGEYADDAWFAERETRCEAVLADFFGRPLSEDGRSSRHGLNVNVAKAVR